MSHVVKTVVFRSSFVFARRLRVHPGNEKEFSELTMVDESQLRRIMFDKTGFQNLLKLNTRSVAIAKNLLHNLIVRYRAKNVKKDFT